MTGIEETSRRRSTPQPGVPLGQPAAAGTIPHYTDGPVTIWHGDCIDVMRQMPDDSVDAVVTDPPYGLEFMGKDWDSFKTYAGGNPDMKPQGTNVGGTTGGVFAAANYGYRDKNPRCRNCGKLQRGNGSCKCPEPRWDTRTAESANVFQAWCEDWATEAYRLLKPGGHLLAFGGTRTFHRLTAGIEDAGFEIRDSIAWLYGSGFPKSLDVSKAIDATVQHGGSNSRRIKAANDGCPGEGRLGSALPNNGIMSGQITEARIVRDEPATEQARQWQGWGTALKPAFEPIVVARKPLTGTVAANVLAYGTGALNIDASRIVASDPEAYAAKGASVVGLDSNRNGDAYGEWTGKRTDSTSQLGRWPANVVLDEHTAPLLDAQSGVQRDGVAVRRNLDPNARKPAAIYGDYRNGSTDDVGFGGSGGASRFFYTAKASTDERPSVDGIAHPTVKPVDLMRWLVKLVTPPGGVVLEPFAGSGTTVEACVLEGFHCIAIEREADYLPLILKRIRKPHAVGLDFGEWEA